MKDGSKPNGQIEGTGADKGEMGGRGGSLAWGSSGRLGTLALAVERRLRAEAEADTGRDMTTSSNRELGFKVVGGSGGKGGSGRSGINDGDKAGRGREAGGKGGETSIKSPGGVSSCTIRPCMLLFRNSIAQALSLLGFFRFGLTFRLRSLIFSWINHKSIGYLCTRLLVFINHIIMIIHARRKHYTTANA